MKLETKQVYEIFDEGRLSALQYVSFILKQSDGTGKALSKIIEDLDKEVEQLQSTRNTDVIRILIAPNENLIYDEVKKLPEQKQKELLEYTLEHYPKDTKLDNELNDIPSDVLEEAYSTWVKKLN